ncbi:Nn.00g079530.m01.CDS01 [Neocucurbitaria sp. VM-36]
MESALPVPLTPIRRRTRSNSISSDEDSLEQSYRIADHQSVNAEDVRDPLLSQIGQLSLAPPVVEDIANHCPYTEQNGVASDSGHSKPPSGSDHHLKVRSSQFVVKSHGIKHASPGLISCAITWLLVASFYILIWLHKDRVISPQTKSNFDAVVVALSMVFGLNIASGLKGIALDLRWWILDARKRSDRELVQTGIATLSLTLSGQSGPADIYRETGLSDMAVPNFTAFAPNPGRFDNRYLAECVAAHILGDIGSSYNYTTLPAKALSDTPWAHHPASFWNATNHWEYVFLDSAVQNSTLTEVNITLKAVSIYTDQIVKASGICQTPAFWSSEDDHLQIIHINSTGEAIYFPLLPPEAVFYLTTPVLSTPTAQCGSGCGNVKVLEEAAGPPVPGSLASSFRYFYYDCNITVSTTASLSDTNAAVAAQAIALSGQLHPEIFTKGPGNNQWGSYTNGVPFGEPQNNSAMGMASLLSRFAIGVVAAAAETNPKSIIKGRAPAQGVRIQLHNPALFSLILLLTGLIQSCLFSVAVKFGSRFEVPVVAISHQEEIRKRFVIEPAGS